MSSITNQPFISIIIPVYNDDKNISRCLDSILSQTYTNYECLLIDDGSTDNSSILCDSYSKKDKRIKLFHKNHEGISKSRQFGIASATGEYIYFVDSDDYVEPELTAALARKFNEDDVDICFLNFYEENLNKKKHFILQNYTSFDCETVLQLVLMGKLYSCLWNVVIKRELYIKNGICFADNINYGEDSLFIIELLLNKPKLVFLSDAYYHHIINQFSFTKKNRKQKLIERLDFLECLSILLKKYSRNDLNRYNYFPLNDKFEMLTSGLFTKKEYHDSLSLETSSYFLKQYSPMKYILLVLAETNFYFIAKFMAICSRSFKKLLKTVYNS